jgi:drug/metabolite transporter (DMT)-like permease
MTEVTKRLVLLLLAVAVFFGATAAILIRWSYAPTTTQVFYRLLFTTAFVLPIALVRDRDAFSRLTRRDATISLVSGVALGAHFVLLFRGVTLTSVAAAITLVQTHAALIPVVAWYAFDEGVTKRMSVGLTTAFVGVVLLATGGFVNPFLFSGPNPALGNLLSAVAAVGFTAYAIAGRSVRSRLSLFPYVTIVYGSATVAVGIFSLATGVPILHSYPAREWMIFLALALGPGLITHTLINWSLKYLRSAIVSVSFLVVPAVSTVLAYLLLDEQPGWITIIFGIIILFGVYFTLTGTPDDASPA